MANEYVTTAQLKVPLSIDDSIDDVWLAVCATAASRAIDSHCGRRFYLDTTATARTFAPRSYGFCPVDDLVTTTAFTVKTDSGGTGTFDQTWAATDYQTEPANSIGPNGSTWPVTGLTAIAALTFPCDVRRRVQVTATWGWPAVPPEVAQAAYLLGSELYKRKDAPFGVAGVADFGVLRIREDARYTALLADYCTYGVGGVMVA